MPEKVNSKKDDTKKLERIDEWARDQQDREYYYDDSHGYEEYDPADDEENEDCED